MSTPAKLTVAALAAMAALAHGGQAATDGDPKAHIAALCKELGEGQYGSLPAHDQLVEIGEAAIPQLLLALKDPRPQARWWAVAAVCKIGTDQGYQAALEVLRDDPHPFVRSTAVYHLHHFLKKGKDIWPVAQQYLADKDGEVARWALTLMAMHGCPDIDKALRQVLAKGSPEARSYALERVRRLLDQEPEKARGYLPLIRPLVAAEDTRVRYDAVHATVALLESGQLGFLHGVWQKDTHPTVQECVLRCITVIPSPPVESFDLFVLGMQSEHEEVRQLASRLLCKAYKAYFSYNPKAPLPLREDAIRKWQAWYAENHKKLQWDADRRRFVLPGQDPPKPEDERPADPPE